MSSSRLKPSATPCTALATSVRASPWNFRSSPSSRASAALTSPFDISNVMPGGSGCRNCPLGPFTSTASSPIDTVTPLGIGMGRFPMRDIRLDPSQAIDYRLQAAGGVGPIAGHRLQPVACRLEPSPVSVPYQTLQSTSPPTPARAASRPLITPREVVRMLVPRPPSTRGTSARPKYTRRPGRLMRSMPEMTRSPCGPYFRNTRIIGVGGPPRTTGSSTILNPWMYPSSWRMRAISAFNLEAGMSTRVCLECTALRMRVSMSAIGSVMSVNLLTWVTLQCRAAAVGEAAPLRFSSRYQLLFVTPVTSPSSASLRKHSRHNANFRMYARGRPHRRQRLRRRILYFGGLASLAIFAVVAILC